MWLEALNCTNLLKSSTEQLIQSSVIHREFMKHLHTAYSKQMDKVSFLCYTKWIHLPSSVLLMPLYLHERTHCSRQSAGTVKGDLKPRWRLTCKCTKFANSSIRRLHGYDSFAILTKSAMSSRPSCVAEVHTMSWAFFYSSLVESRPTWLVSKLVLRA